MRLRLNPFLGCLFPLLMTKTLRSPWVLQLLSAPVTIPPEVRTRSCARVPIRAVRGRGTAPNRLGRVARHIREANERGWTPLPRCDAVEDPA